MKCNDRPIEFALSWDSSIHAVFFITCFFYWYLSNQSNKHQMSPYIHNPAVLNDIFLIAVPQTYCWISNRTTRFLSNTDILSTDKKTCRTNRAFSKKIKIIIGMEWHCCKTVEKYLVLLVCLHMLRWIKCGFESHYTKSLHRSVSRGQSLFFFLGCELWLAHLTHLFLGRRYA